MNILMVIFFYILFCFILLIGWQNVDYQKCLSLDNLLIIIAHPDDESMFFGPTIVNEVKCHSPASIFLLCLSSGNQDGYGKFRKQELIKAAQVLGIGSERVEIIDNAHFQDSMALSWDHVKIKEVVLSKIIKENISTMITFDESGISLHPNHIDIAKAVIQLKETGIRIFQLETVQIYRKYILFNDILISLFDYFNIIRDQMLILRCSSISDYITLVKSLYQHQSQMVWFRKLYSVFSRYMFINTLKMV